MPLKPPSFSSDAEYLSRKGDADFWRPYIAEVFGRHDMRVDGELVGGFNSTWPTFLCGEHVIKFFAHSAHSQPAFEAERAAHALIATDSEIRAPQILADGQLGDAWAYLISTRMPGMSVRDAGLSFEQLESVAVQLGEQVRRVHALTPAGVATHADWAHLDVRAANAQSSLPPHLVEQIDDYLPQYATLDNIFTHGDLARMHVFVEGDTLAGIIDWGDAMVSDRHVELIQPHRDLFSCDKGLLKTFLKFADWKFTNDFPQRALAHALHRQAIGLAQHHSMDVFEPVAKLLPLKDIATLTKLADRLFSPT